MKHKREEFHLEKGIEKKTNDEEEEEKAWNRNSILGQ